MEPTREEKNWAVILHLSQLSGYAIPLGGYLVPLAIWYIKKDQLPFVDRQGVEVINFSITMMLLLALAGILYFFVIGFLILPLAFAYAVIMPIVAAFQVSQGKPFRYPFILRLIS